MHRILAKSPKAVEALNLVEEIQHYFVSKLDTLSQEYGEKCQFQPVEWFRQNGDHGGGVRYEACDETLFNQGSVNVSQVQYDSNPEKNLASATAISTIIHPLNPHAPSMHMHISWTELKDGKGYWRMMADLNPSISNADHTKTFTQMLKNLAPQHTKEALDQGDKYFFIPALNRHRGVAHFYLENFNSGDAQADYNLAKKVGISTVDCYIELLDKSFQANEIINDEDIQAQLDYHTLYLFQVLTLDRGTTSGLLIHNQNDIGILGSLPNTINKKLLASWIEKLQDPQDKLLQALVDAMPDKPTVHINETIKAHLAQAVRTHYQTYPESLSLQASGNSVPPTVANHS